MAHLGAPLLGDWRYIELARAELAAAGETRQLAPRVMLHAWRIGITHPSTRAPLEVTAPAPSDLLAVAWHLRLDDGLARVGLESVG
jgi:23S rRNA pseudouridine1911/1915/1917 synthase